METSLLFFKTMRKLGFNWVRKKRAKKKSDCHVEIKFYDIRIGFV